MDRVRGRGGGREFRPGVGLGAGSLQPLVRKITCKSVLGWAGGDGGQGAGGLGTCPAVGLCAVPLTTFSLHENKGEILVLCVFLTLAPDPCWIGPEELAPSTPALDLTPPLLPQFCFNSLTVSSLSVRVNSALRPPREKFVVAAARWVRRALLVRQAVFTLEPSTSKL